MGAKVIAVIMSVGLLIFPFLLASIIGAIISGDFLEVFTNSISPWYFIDPLLTFAAQCYLVCIKDKEYMSDSGFKLFGGLEPSNGLYCGVMVAQTIFFFLLNVCLDSYIMHGYQRRSSHQGAEPPLLDAHDDVKEHENNVKNNGNRLQDDD